MKNPISIPFEFSKEKWKTLAIYGLISIGILISLFFLIWGIHSGLGSIPGDFRYRYNEAMHVRFGIDPFDVYINNMIGLGTRVEVHTPFTYFFVLPFTLLPLESATILLLILNALALLGSIIIVFVITKNLTNSFLLAGLAASQSFATLAVMLCFLTHTFSLICIFGILLLIIALEKNNFLLAGLGLFLSILKPQMGCLIIIPLILKVKVKALICFGVLCLIALGTISIMLEKAPWTLLLEVVNGGQSYLSGGTYDRIRHYKLFSIFNYYNIGSQKTLQMFSLLTGIGVTIFCNFRTAFKSHPFFWVAPAAISGLFAFYGHPTDLVSLSLMIIIAVLILNTPTVHYKSLFYAYIIITAAFPSIYRYLSPLGVSIYHLWRFGSVIFILFAFYSSPLFNCLIARKSRL